MELYKILAQERVQESKSHRTDGRSEARRFIYDVRDLKTLCFDRRVPTFKNKEDRYSFWSKVLHEI